MVGKRTIYVKQSPKLFFFVETAMGVQINAMEETEHTKYTEAAFG